MDIERLNNEVIRLKKLINKIPSMRFGMILNQVVENKPLVIGVFEFTCNSHDTGIDVKVDIIKGDDRLNIINGTYWYCESTYGFNKFHRLSGAWDSSLEAAIKEIELMAIKKIEAKIKDNEDWIAKIKKEDSEKKARFESMF